MTERKHEAYFSLLGQLDPAKLPESSCFSWAHLHESDAVVNRRFHAPAGEPGATPTLGQPRVRAAPFSIGANQPGRL